MVKKVLAVISVLIVSLVGVSSAFAQQGETKEIHFSPGSISATVEGDLIDKAKGNEIDTWRLYIQKGQTLSIEANQGTIIGVLDETGGTPLLRSDFGLRIFSESVRHTGYYSIYVSSAVSGADQHYTLTVTIPPLSGGNPNVTLYTVKSGDTLYRIAARYGVTVAALKQANLLNSNNIYVGQVLTIPDGNNGGNNDGGTGGPTPTYLVQRGDTLTKIAYRFGSSVSALKSANNLSTDSIYVGQSLKIPTSGSYTVKSGDTVAKIAASNGVTTGQLAALNGIANPDRLVVGQKILLPKK